MDYPGTVYSVEIVYKDRKPPIFNSVQFQKLLFANLGERIRYSKSKIYRPSDRVYVYLVSRKCNQELSTAYTKCPWIHTQGRY